MTITLEAIRAAGGIVHSDGNIFFRDISMLQGLAGEAPAAVTPQGERKWICPTRTVADLVNNLLTMDQALPVYGAQYIERDGRRCAIAVPPTVSRERVKDGRWIGQGEELNAAVVWTRAEQPSGVALWPQGEYPPLPEPDSYLFQHEETGLTQYVDAQQVDWGFEKNNPRWKKCDGVFSESQLHAYFDLGRQPAAVAGPAREEIAALRAEHGITSTGRGIKEFEQVDAFVRAVLQRWGAAPALEAPAAPSEADIAAAREHIADVHNATQMRSALSQLRPDVVVELVARGLVPPIYAPMAAVAAAPQAPAQAAPAAPGVPAGFALVPIEPTQQMLDAGRWSGAGSVSIQEEWARKEVWSRMLATITPPPAAYADDLVALVENLAQALSAAAPGNDLAGHALDYLKRNGLQGSPLQAAEAAPQAPAAPVVAPAQGDPAALLQLAEVLESGRSLIDIERKEAAEALRRQAAAAQAAPAVPAVDADPLGPRDVGEALMETIERNADALKAVGWLGPIDCPSEIVVDLLNLLEEANTTSALGEWVATLEVDSGGGLDYETVPPCTLPAGCYPLYRAAQAKEGGAAA